jgi:hypothetical protein
MMREMEGRFLPELSGFLAWFYVLRALGSLGQAPLGGGYAKPANGERPCSDVAVGRGVRLRAINLNYVGGIEEVLRIIVSVLFWQGVTTFNEKSPAPA